MNARERFEARFQSWPDRLLTVLLLLASAVIALIAIWPGHPELKAVTLAYIGLP